MKGLVTSEKGGAEAKKKRGAEGGLRGRQSDREHLFFPYRITAAPAGLSLCRPLLCSYSSCLV